MIYTINGALYDSNYLAHHGIKGMKWGVRRYQNPDGSLTAAGRKRYGVKELKAMSKEAINYEYKISRSDPRNQTLSEIEDRAFRIAKKYGIDMDDGGGGDQSRYTDEQLRAASREYLDLWERHDTISDEISTDSFKKAQEYINDKYGDTAYRSVQRYDTTVKNLEFFGFIGALGALAITPAILDRYL